MAFTNLPPSFQEIFRRINDRMNKLETAPNQAMYTATAASAQATAAMLEAQLALDAAQGAYVIASQSIIKSAQTITNASNQLEAIDATGITVYSGASSTSGARVLMNSLGIVGYNSSDTATFTLDATNGNISMTGASFTNGTIFGGSLNINGNCIINSSGYLTATGATITGTIYSSAGTLGGFTIGTDKLSANSGNTYIDSTTGIFYALGGMYTSGELKGNGMTVTGSASVTASLTVGTSNQFQYLSSSGTLRSAYTYGKAVTGRAMQINSTGDFGTTASTRRKKHDIVPYAINSEALLQLGVKKFKYNTDIDPDQKDQHGFIAEEAQALGLNELIQFDAQGLPDYFAYEKLSTFLLQLVQELDARLKILEGN